MVRAWAAGVVVALGLVPLAGCTTDADPSPSDAASPDLAASATDLDVDLRDELLQMAALDQAVRGGPVPKGMDACDVPTIDEVDASNQARIVEIFDAHGWPGWSLVGRRGSTAAWTVVQHADLDLALQERGLDLLTDAVAADDASPGDLAYLTDRVLVAKGRPQVYGTQWEPAAGGRWVPRTPIADRATVDDRRDQVGLGPLEDYVAELTSSAGQA